MVVDVATALMYVLIGIVVCFPCLVWIPCLPWGRIVLTFCWILVLPVMVLALWGLVSMVSVGWAMALFC